MTHSRLTPWLLSGLLLISGLSLTAQLAMRAKQEDQEKLNAAFQGSANIAINTIRSRLNSYELIIKGVKGFYEGSEKITIKEFHTYVSTLNLQDNLGLLALGLVTLVPDNEKTTHILAMQQQGFADYRIHPEGQRPVYAPITHIEPATLENKRALGFDTLPTDNARLALEQSRDQGTLAISRRLTLAQDENTVPKIAFVMYLPVYRKNLPLESIADRRAAILGWVDAPFRIEDLVNNLAGHFNRLLDVEIYDQLPLSEQSKIHDTDTVSREARSAAGHLQMAHQLAIGGQQWSVSISTTPAYEASVITGNQPILLALIGSLLSVLLSRMVLTLLRRRENAEIRYRQLFEQSADGILVLTHDFRLINANPAALELLGFSLQELQSLPLVTELLNGFTGDEGRLENLKTGAVYKQKGWHTRKDGSEFLAEISCLKLTSRQICMVLHDITQRHQAEQQLIENEAKLSSILDNVGACIFLKDIDGHYLYANRPVLELWNTQLDDILGLSDEQFFDAESAARIRENDLQVLKEGKTINKEEINTLNANGQTSIYLTQKLPLRREDGSIYALCGISSDITERKQLELALRDNERWLLDSQRIAGIGSWRLDLATGKFSCSAEADRIFQKPSVDYQYTSENFLQQIHPQDRSRLQQWLEQATTGQHVPPMEFRTLQSDSSVCHIEGRAEAVLDPLTQLPIVLEGTLQDITYRKQLQADLQRWADAFKYCAHGIGIGNPITNQLMTCNPAFARLLGYESHLEMQGMSILAFYADHEQKKVMDYLKQANLQGYARYETQMRRKDDTLVDVQMDLVGVKDSQGQLQYRVATMQDISQRKQHEATLQLQSSALASAANAIMITDQTGTIEWINPAFTELTGYQPEEAIGHAPQELVKSGLQPQSFYNDLWQTILSGKVWRGEIINQRKDGSLYTEEQIITPVLDDQHVIRHFIAIKQDISTRKQNEAELALYRNQLEQLVEERTSELENARQEAEHLSQIKSVFLANMSHEIRTPMNAVLGFCFLLEKQPLADESRQLVKKISDAGKSLLTIINDVLDFSKIEAGRLDIECYPFSLREVLAQVNELMLSCSRGKPVDLIIQPPPNQIDRLVGDGPRIQQVLINLLSNALKFTEQGKVELSIETVSEQPNLMYLRFTVKDTGIGISSDKQQEIFSAFTQADSSINRRFGGTGLGLAISQQLVRLMGGTLEVTSQEGEGSTFCFTLPLQPDPEAQSGSQPTPNLNLPSSVTQKRLAGIRVLVVDDSEINQEVALGILKEEGGIVSLANDGQQALDWLNAHPDEVDIILMDIQMPVLDGYAATRLIRQDRRWQQLPIIALTAGIFQSLHETAQNAGMNDFVIKPFDVNQLIAVIQKHTRQYNSSVAIATSDSSPSDSRSDSLNNDYSALLPDIDAAYALKQWGNETVYRKYLHKFVDSYADAGNSIAQSLGTKDFTAASAISHKLKGVAGNLGMPEVMSHAQEVDRLLAAQEAPYPTISTLQAAIDQVCTKIADWDSEHQPSPIQSKPKVGWHASAELLTKLLAALNDGNLNEAESILAQLQGTVPDDEFNKIQVPLTDFDFQAAVTAAQNLLERVQADKA